MTDIFLHQGEASPSDVRLTDPTALAVAEHTITATGIASASALGAVALNGAIAAAGVASAGVAGVPGVNGQIAPVAIASAAALGAPTVEPEAPAQQPGGGRPYYPPQLPLLYVPEPHLLMPIGVPSAAAVGRPSIAVRWTRSRRTREHELFNELRPPFRLAA